MDKDAFILQWRNVKPHEANAQSPLTSLSSVHPHRGQLSAPALFAARSARPSARCTVRGEAPGARTRVSPLPGSQAVGSDWPLPP